MRKHLPVSPPVTGLARAVKIPTCRELRLSGCDHTAAGVLMLVFCPAAIISAIFIDFNPHSVEAFAGWSVIALLNGTIYAAVGTFIKRFRTRSAAVVKS